ncbi:MAG: hypothetical protein ACR5LG_09400 [Sodalis sp. (in: enterobacteria)]|uniref:hypothetical protein n=1 Tax=Sodalis sp. (in: enterobacteria) TaxID=1898979 RepID=UPI003F3C4A0E
MSGKEDAFPPKRLSGGQQQRVAIARARCVRRSFCSMNRRPRLILNWWARCSRTRPTSAPGAFSTNFSAPEGATLFRRACPRWGREGFSYLPDTRAQRPDILLQSRHWCFVRSPW